MGRILIQDLNTGRALPSDLPLTHSPRWKAYVDRDGGRTSTRWKPLANLIRRVRRDCERRGILLSKFRQVESHVREGHCFPDYFAEALRASNDNKEFVVIVCDPDVVENVLYAYGSALD